MTPELDQPFGRHRWDPLTEIEPSTAAKAPPSTDREDVPAEPVQTDLAD